MASLFQRLFQVGRAHLYDFLDQHRPDTLSTPPREQESETQGRTQRDASETAPPFAEPDTAQGLPRTPELVRCYQLLDLPFGTPTKQVTKQWRSYLKKCHPDRFAKDPARQAEATALTQRLNDAHHKIKVAWERHQR